MGLFCEICLTSTKQKIESKITVTTLRIILTFLEVFLAGMLVFAGTRFDATVHSIPAHLNSLPQYGVFHSGGLPRIPLEDYLMDFVDTSAEDNSIDDEKKQTVFSESEFERSTWVIIVVLLIAISLVTAFIVGILLVNKFWSVEPRIQKNKGEAFTENENFAGYSNFGFTMCSFELATGPKMTTKDVTIPPETDFPPTF